MTTGALRHQFRIVIVQRVIGMKNFMALTTIKLVLATGLLDITEVFWVTLGALSDR